VVLGALFVTDRSTYRESQERRSGFTNSVARVTMPFGAEYGFGVSAALIAGGLVADRPGIRDTGRDALEAGIIAGLIDNLVVKKAAGRTRPGTSNGETVFEPGSGNASFASGHATEAFAVASVIAERSPGWVIPGIAYTLATLVAADRVNVQAHFVSDVFAGAVLGTVTGRWLVHHHEGEAAAGPPGAEIDIEPAAHGVAARIRF
jgi:membrane-associated phospholipid phosphatase